MSSASEVFCRAVAAGDWETAKAAAMEAIRNEPSMRVGTDPDLAAAVANFCEWLRRCRCVNSVEATSGLLKSQPPQKLLILEPTHSVFPRKLHLTLLLERPTYVVSIETG